MDGKNECLYWLEWAWKTTSCRVLATVPHNIGRVFYCDWTGRVYVNLPARILKGVSLRLDRVESQNVYHIDFRRIEEILALYNYV